MLDSKYVYTFISRFIEIMYIHPMNFEREIYIYNLSLYANLLVKAKYCKSNILEHHLVPYLDLFEKNLTLLHHAFFLFFLLHFCVHTPIFFPFVLLKCFCKTASKIF